MFDLDISINILTIFYYCTILTQAVSQKVLLTDLPFRCLIFLVLKVFWEFLIAVEIHIHRWSTYARSFEGERKLIAFLKLVIIVIIVIIIIILKVFFSNAKEERGAKRKVVLYCWSSWPSADISKHMYTILFRYSGDQKCGLEKLLATEFHHWFILFYPNWWLEALAIIWTIL